MKLLLCVDDTDDLTKSISTGAIVSKIVQELTGLGAQKIEGISRHQLLLNSEIAYTSHNSSMCASLVCDGIEKETVIQISRDIIHAFKAESADPGLAICWLDELEHPQDLIEYGFRAKQIVITKQEAYDFAARDAGLFLEELGGSGIGVIGALAGLGLRLSRCDGTLRGRTGEKVQGQTLPACEMLNHLGVSAILDEHGRLVNDDEMVFVAEIVKRSYWDGKLVAWSQKDEQGRYRLCGDHGQTEIYSSAQGSDCNLFEWDNDVEELRGNDDPGCLNCLYRRWLSEGYRCVKGQSVFDVSSLH